MYRFQVILLLMWLFSSPLYAQQYVSTKNFVSQTLGEDAMAEVLWLDAELRAELKQYFTLKTLDEALPGARIRYWQAGDQRVWVLNQVGRDKPITMGFVIREKKIVSMKILAFRESRGWEVRYPRFTSQFQSLGVNKYLKLDAPIDNITGATLSVNAVKRSARLALYLDALVSTRK